ncbi:carboxypeptidase-like regulatory domain-containing protein, partial [Psychroflexus sp. MES1-P1E]|uniref:carboxypeptidase-like regulatory domain-containing protein n=1 Tax=Psychroflexus sp. MES1-P1E TaxID=2058320 RepID=UPI000CC1184C
MKHSLLLLFALITSFALAQTKVSGYIYDTSGEPVPYVNVIFFDSSEGIISDENGKFYLQSDKNYSFLEFSFMGFETLKFPLNKKTTYNIEINLEENSAELSEVIVYSG